MSGKPWSPEDDANLRRMWGEGQSASQIGNQIGRTRSSVIGRVHRLGLADHGDVACVKRGPQKQVAGNMRAKPGLAPVAVKPTAPGEVGAKAVPAALPAPVLVPLVAPHNVTLLELTGCKWPVNEGGPYRFCNDHREGEGPYCKAHAALAYTPGPRSFSLDDDDIIRRLWDGGRGIIRLCRSLGRNKGVVIIRAKQLGLQRVA